MVATSTPIPSYLTLVKKLASVSLAHHPPGIRRSVYFTMDFEMIGKYEVDREHNAKEKEKKKREKGRETDIEVIVG